MECFLESRVLHNFLALDWCLENGVKVEDVETFEVQLVDALEVHEIRKVSCFVDLGLMKKKLTFYVLDYNACVLHMSFL